LLGECKSTSPITTTTTTSGTDIIQLETNLIPPVSEFLFVCLSCVEHPTMIHLARLEVGGVERGQLVAVSQAIDVDDMTVHQSVVFGEL
jgi:hypothetical protein